jgi:acetylornithine deacetylase/succinyl-diaminopimelate desuccinylase-like protein
MAALAEVLEKIDANLELALERLFRLIEIPSVSTDPAYAGDCARAAEWLAAELRSIGFEASVRETSGHPMVVGNAQAARPDVPHLLLYGHYDVQPPDPLDLWESPPFEPRIAEAATGKRIVGRGVADDKGQLMTFLEACRAFHETGGLPCHITFLIEGEEETGSPSLPAFLDKAKDELRADMALVCDSLMWDRETPAVTTMLRGLLLEEVVMPPIAISIRGCLAVLRLTPFMCLRASLPICAMGKGTSRFPASIMGSPSCQMTPPSSGAICRSTKAPFLARLGFRSRRANKAAACSK